MTRNTHGHDHPRQTTTGDRLANVTAALLAVTVTIIHIADQGGLTAMKDPAYLGYGYWMLEIAGLVCAALLLIRPGPIGWIIAAGVAAGPLIGITISRSVGLPDATDDIGNWFEPLGMLAMAVEAALLVLSLSMLNRARTSTYART